MVASVVAVGGGVSSAYAQQFVPIPQPVGAVHPYYAADVNDAGVVVGQYFDEDGRVHSTLLVNGVHQSIDVLGALGTQAFGINNLGQVVGMFADSNGSGVPFIYTNGVHAPLVLPGVEALPLDINDHGVVVGTTWDPSFAIALGFVSGPAGNQLVRYPAAVFTTLESINNSGEAVGLAQSATGTVSVRYRAGALTLLSPVDGAGCYLTGISDAADLVGGCADGTGYLFSGGSALRLTYGGDPSTQFNKISASGTIVGSSNSGAFVLLRSKLVDPVPDLLAGPAVTSTPSALASDGRLVQGVAADGVARVVVRIPAATAGQQFTVRLLNDHAPRALSTSDKEDGALATVAAQTSWVSQLTVTAESDTGTTPMAFVIYRSPEDFPRVGTPVAPGAFGPDDFKASRQVFLEITPMGGPPYVQVVEVVRPPVVLVHGIWAQPDSWDQFEPVSTASADILLVGRADYSQPVAIFGTLPAQQPFVLKRARRNSLGLRTNASAVFSEARKLVTAVAEGRGPAGIPVAAIQADVIAHSMGGVVTRTLFTDQRYFASEDFRRGRVHKMITVDTPHLGTPLAARLLQPEDACVRDALVQLDVLGVTVSKTANFSFVSAALSAREIVNGAAGDLVPSSAALLAVANDALTAVPMAFVSTSYEQWSSLDDRLPPAGAWILHRKCRGVSPLARDLTPARWPLIFGVNEPSDGIVGRTSHLNGTGQTASVTLSGFAHSKGTQDLGFDGKHAQEGEVAVTALGLINRPAYSAMFFQPTP